MSLQCERAILERSVMSVSPHSMRLFNESSAMSLLTHFVGLSSRPYGLAWLMPVVIVVFVAEAPAHAVMQSVTTGHSATAELRSRGYATESSRQWRPEERRIESHLGSAIVDSSDGCEVIGRVAYTDGSGMGVVSRENCFEMAAAPGFSITPSQKRTASSDQQYGSLKILPAASGLILVESRVANSPPEVPDVCAAMSEDTALAIPVLQIDRDADGDPLRIIATTQPQSGTVVANEDGSITFTAAEPGLQSFRYTASTGRRGSASANVSVFVIAVEAARERPVLEGLDDQQLSSLARACSVSVVAEKLTALEGAVIRVEHMAPGERVQVQAHPGQRIELQSRDFVDATYLVVDGDLLIVTHNGNIVFVSGLAAAAGGDSPPTFSVAEGPAVAADELLAHLQPVALPETEFYGLPASRSGYSFFARQRILRLMGRR